MARLAVTDGGWLRSRLPPWPDVAVVSLLLVIVVLEYATSGPDATYRYGSRAWNVAVELGVVLPLLLRSRHPVAVLAVSCGALGLTTLLAQHDLFFWGTLLPLGIAHYTVARHRTFRVALLALVLPAAAFALYWTGTPAMRHDRGLIFFFPLTFGTSLVAGWRMQRDAEQRRRLRDALARLAGEREQAARLVVLDERAKLARDLHDVVASALSIMMVQARRAQTVLNDDPEAARAAVTALEASGRGATAELRRMLGLLRSTDDPDSRAPAEGLAQLDELVQRMRAAGLRIHASIEAGDALPPGFDLAAYRVVQEALTNVLKHAGPTDVTVRVEVSDTVRIEVTDDGPRSAPPVGAAPGGHGLLGMRERVLLYGGQLETGPQGDGFAVRVRLPLPVAA